MNKDDILKKYFAGETSLAEEQWLFEQMEDSQIEEENAFASVVDELRHERYEGDIATQTISIKRSWKMELFAAAAILLMFFFYTNNQQGPNPSASDRKLTKHLLLDKDEDVFLAYDHSRETLLYVSEHINRANGELAKINMINNKIITVKK